MSTEVDMFASTIELVELTREEARIKERKRERRAQKNIELVALGRAVMSTNPTQAEVVQSTWDTVARHRRLMNAAGKPVSGPEKRPTARNEFVIKAPMVRIAADVGIVLVQASKGVVVPESRNFCKLWETEGLDYALDQFAKPATTQYGVMDLTTHMRVGHGTLAPRSADVTEGLGLAYDAFIPFNGDHNYESPAERVEELINTEISADKLLMTAGYTARFNLVLDEVEAALR